MELIGSLLLILALALLVGLFVARPFILRTTSLSGEALSQELEHEHDRSALLAERDRLLNALQELDFDYTLGKVPAEDYPVQRSVLLRSGAEVLRRLDEIQPEDRKEAGHSLEERIEAAVAARRADAGANSQTVAQIPAQRAAARGDSLEELIALRKRQRQETTAGFCPKCGKPVQKSDKFCSRCGTTV